MKVWLNGDVTEAGTVIRFDDRGFTLGDGLFETLAVRDGEPVLVEAHLRRLRHGCESLVFPSIYSGDVLREAMAATIAANGIVHGVLRLTVTRGPTRRGLLPPEATAPTVLMTAEPTPPVPPAPARVVTAGESRRNEHSALSRIKSLNYLDGILAAMEAKRRGAEDALLLNTAGALAEATASNLFAVLDGRAVTPPVADGALPGIMRAVVRELLDADERTLRPDDLTAAAEVFLTNSAGIRPVVLIDDRPVGTGKPGPVWASLGGLALGRSQP